MTEQPDSPLWRIVYGVAVTLVLGAFLYSLQTILNPFVLFLLLVLLVSPQAGSRYHLLVVGASAVLMIVWLLDTTGFLLAPFILALVLAYILHPMVRRIEGPRIPRSLAIAILALPILGALAALVLVGVPLLGDQVARFIRSVPALLDSAVVLGERAQAQIARWRLPFVDEEALLVRIRGIRPEAVIGYLEARQELLARQTWQAILGAGRGIGTVLTILSYIFLTPILMFYLLRDYERITIRLAALIPDPHREAVVGFFTEYDHLLSRYLRGQLLAAAIIGVLTGILFLLMGFPYALMLGAVAGVFNVVPYLGAVMSLIAAVIISLFSGSILLSLGKVALVFAIVQVLENAVVSPRIVGESVGLHPVWVILALAVAGYFWGFVGLLIAIPLAVLLKLVLVTAIARYEASRLFRGSSAVMAD